VLGDKFKGKKSQNPCIRNNVSKSSLVMYIFSFFVGDGGMLEWNTMYDMFGCACKMGRNRREDP
jgi:hypothetical protein